MIAANAKLAAAVMLAAVCAAPGTAGAQAPSYATRTETITGSIASVQNVNHLFVSDDRGFTDDVTLRSGASVAGGVRLEPGVRVTIDGSAAGHTFLATRIATHGRSYAAESAAPYTYSYAQPYPVPVPVYYPAYYPANYAPAMYYGYGSYGYGWGIGLNYGRLYRGYRPFHGPYRPYRPYRPGRVGVFIHVR